MCGNAGLESRGAQTTAACDSHQDPAAQAQGDRPLALGAQLDDMIVWRFQGGGSQDSRTEEQCLALHHCNDMVLLSCFLLLLIS